MCIKENMSTVSSMLKGKVSGETLCFCIYINIYAIFTYIIMLFMIKIYLHIKIEFCSVGGLQTLGISYYGHRIQITGLSS